ncbi:hypothetical protein ACHAWF_013136 [Thalassiosira exigua]
MSRRALASVGGGGGGGGLDEPDLDDPKAAEEREAIVAGGSNSPPRSDARRNDAPDDPDADPSLQDEPPAPAAAAAGASLLEQAALLKKQHESLSHAEQAAVQRRQDEDRILKEASHVQTNALQAASELAEGVKYKSSLPTGWRCPRKILQDGEGEWEKVRKKWHILVEGEDCPPPIRSFVDMAFPVPIIEALKKKNVKRPTPIQMQGLTVALSGRDMVGIAFTGSGKTLSFSLPLVMAALEEEARMPLVPGEGPVGIVLAPSRELARQTLEVVTEYCTALNAHETYPGIRAQLLIGGESGRDQLVPFREKGVHCVVATPGRLRDFLKKVRGHFVAGFAPESSPSSPFFLFPSAIHHFGYLQVHLFGRGGSHARFGVRRGSRGDHESLSSPAADDTVFGHVSQEVPRLRASIARESHRGQRGQGGRGELGRHPGGRIRQARGQDRVPPRMLAKDGTSGGHLLRKERRRRRHTRVPAAQGSRGGEHPRRQGSGRAQRGDIAVQDREERRVGRDRHRRQGIGFRGHPARDQLRHARRDRELRPSHRPHRSMREDGRRDDVHQQKLRGNDVARPQAFVEGGASAHSAGVDDHGRPLGKCGSERRDQGMFLLRWIGTHDC